MKRFNKVALIPAAVAAVLAGNAYAGTEACFEIYKADSNFTIDQAAIDAQQAIIDNAGSTDAQKAAAKQQIITLSSNIANFATRYNSATCDFGPADSDGSSKLVAKNPAKVAYELTGSLELDFENVGADTVVGDQKDIHIVYIPTTNIPSSTKLVFKLNGAVFHGNANKIHLVKDNDGLADGLQGADNDGFRSIGDSDGSPDGTDTITFVTKNVEIPAGTRLVLSRTSEGTTTDSNTLDPIGIKIANEVCTSEDAANEVTIRVTEAKTAGGGGLELIGALAGENQIVDISPQFYSLQEGAASEVKVNAESTGFKDRAIVARTEFVFDGESTSVNKTQAIYATNFYDRKDVLDRSITLAADDHLETSFVATGEQGEAVKVGLFDTRNDNAADDTTPAVLSNQRALEDAVNYGVMSIGDAAKVVYSTDADELFTNADGARASNYATAALAGSGFNTMYYAVENTDTTKIMNFNYEVETNYKLNFASEAYLDHCDASKVTHKVGVNGAVLKVPYAVSGEGNFVRVTNEHDKEAEVTVDVFGESADGTEANRRVQAVRLGTVPAQSSVVYFVPDVIEQAEAQKAYSGADGGYAAKSLGDNATNAVSSKNRHTLTFTVTAPRETVHGVSVQRITGGVDRVMPVLDQNTWSQ